MSLRRPKASQLVSHSMPHRRNEGDIKLFFKLHPPKAVRVIYIEILGRGQSEEIELETTRRVHVAEIRFLTHVASGVHNSWNASGSKERVSLKRPFISSFLIDDVNAPFHV